ncbi:Disease resistance protein [Corchorus olitorius]|uniref:Disease resistance protein n=1 Tax=Corchorus olitorius TaxID=93759 RepID=A0A1R3HTP2_9ROSI|nr:Disease resistance protein [Corchorus olitorius]
MAKALLSMVLEQLGGSFIPEEIKNHVGLAVGIEEEIHKLTSNFEAIQAVLEDAERKQVKEASVRNWLCKLKDVSYDVEDVLDEWNTAKLKSRLAKEERAAEDAHLLKKLRYSISLSSSQIILQHNIAQKIKELNGRLDFIAAEKDRYKFELGRTAHDQEPEQQQITTSFIDVTDVYGRDEDKNAVLNMLLEEKGDEESLFQIISIVGMGGIGKTTLARLAYNENVVNTHFEKKIWVCVSDPFDDIKIAKAILESLGDVPNVLELQALLQRIRKSIAGKKFLLVLDDVWNEDDSKWEPFKESLSCGSLGSKILMTTRKENVAAAMGSTTLFPLGKLAKEESWLLFSRIAFSGRTSRECQIFEDFGRKIADKCQGLPLALKTLGGLMRFKRTIEQWRSVLNSEIWELKEAEREVNGFRQPKVDTSDGKGRHLMLVLGEKVEFPTYTCNVEKLRSLLVEPSNYYACIVNDSLPKLFNQVTCLRALDLTAKYCTTIEFSVSEGGTCESSSIGELGSLIYLQDYLEIRGLGNVRDVNEAKKAKLQTKQCLLNLLLKFDMDEKKAAEGGITNGDALVLEALQPPPYLECLEIHNYRGPCTLPKWMFALTNLRYLAVCSCRNWERLPPFGKLPSLESLWIYDTRRVKKMGVEFLGLERDEEHPFSCSSFIPFPKLKRLEMHDMNELEEWEYGVVPFLGNRKERVIMPCLSYLVIDRCPRLKALPHHLHNSSIETLEIRWCPILAKVCSNISSIPNIRVNYMEVKRDRV